MTESRLPIKVLLYSTVLGRRGYESEPCRVDIDFELLPSLRSLEVTCKSLKRGVSSATLQSLEIRAASAIESSMPVRLETLSQLLHLRVYCGEGQCLPKRQRKAFDLFTLPQVSGNLWTIYKSNLCTQASETQMLYAEIGNLTLQYKPYHHAVLYASVRFLMT